MKTAFSLLQRPILKRLRDEGIIKPSDVQEMAIPKIIQGKNLLVVAPTGVGKTYAAMLPIFSMYISARALSKTKPISILYITPLRALNRDIYRRLILLGKALDIRVDIRHGDTPKSARYTQSISPPEMLITTPETLQAILPGSRMRGHLKNVMWVIVDEVHELASDKRGSQLSLALERLRNLTYVDFQRVGLSATVESLFQVGCFLAGEGRLFEVIKSPELKDVEVYIEFVKPTEVDNYKANRFAIPPSNVARARRIIELISEHKSTLIFTNTREHAESLGSLIHALNIDLPVLVHHGSLSKEIREEVENRFQKGEIKAIVCTSSLELGIDVGSVDFVLQYMSPRRSTRLTQRVGRSGHTLKARSKGVIIAGWADDILESKVLVERLEKEDLERTPTYPKPYDVLAHQIVGLTLDFRGVYINQIYETIKKAHPYRDLAIEELLEVLEILERIKLVRVEGDIVRPRTPRSYRYYYENLSVIPDVKRYIVYDFITKRRIGTLDQEFVARRCRYGVDIIMYGCTWKVLRVDDDNLRLDVEPTTPSLEAIPTWEGEMIPVEYCTAMKVGKLRRLIAEGWAAKGHSEFQILEGLSEQAIERLSETIREHANSYPLPTDNKILIERFENTMVVHSCLGNRANETLALVLSTLLNSEYGIVASYQVDPYRIALTTPYKIEAETISKLLRSLTPESLLKIVESTIEESNQFAWRHWHIAKRFGIIERKADYRLNKARTLIRIFRDTPVSSEARKETFIEQLDIESLSEFLKSLREENISINIMEESIDGSCTPLATPILDKVVPHDLLRPALPTGSLIEIVKQRIDKSLVKLVCVHKGDWETLKIVEKSPEILRCPKCKSTLVAVANPNDRDLLTVIKRRLNRRRLRNEEYEKWEQAWKSASLVQVYGKKAVTALAGRGVGPKTAARLLRRPLHKEEELYVEILKAERLYARTRAFWD